MLFFAGQFTGVEGYTESLGTGLRRDKPARRLRVSHPCPAGHHHAGRALIVTFERQILVTFSR
jgi:folate-dependent tRNA-U54 methylase TrmFO/GidA